MKLCLCQLKSLFKNWFHFYYLQSTYFIFQKEEWTIAYKLFAVTTFSSIMIVFFVEVPKLAVQFGLNSFVKIKYRSVTYLMQLHFSTLYIIFLKVLDDFFFCLQHCITEQNCSVLKLWKIVQGKYSFWYI